VDQNLKSDYYILRKQELLQDFEKSAKRWRIVLSQNYGESLVESILQTSRERFLSFIPQIPYIGGDDNHLTVSLVGSVQCLAFYFGMKTRGKSAVEAGKVLYDAVFVRGGEHDSRPSPSPRLSREERMELRKQRAQRSQNREYAWDWVYEFVDGEGESFDYGYDFTECATQKVYQLHEAEEFLPFYCFLDFPKCELGGLGLTRTKTLAEGDECCNFRFKEGGTATQSWPPKALFGK
jgi:hypothetical protein